jgi:hypothetical protein
VEEREIRWGVNSVLLEDATEVDLVASSRIGCTDTCTPREPDAFGRSGS